MVFRHRIGNAVQSLHRLEKCFLCRIAAGGKPLCHVICIHADHGKALCRGIAAVLAADIELLDRIAHLVDGECSGFCTGDQTLGELLCGKSQRRILRGVLIEGVQQIAVLVCTVLCTDSDKVICFFCGNAEVVHQCRSRPCGLVYLIAESITQCKSPLCGFLEFLSHEPSLFGDLCHGVGCILIGFAEVVAVDILDHVPQSLQLCTGCTGRSRHLVDCLVELVTGRDHIAECRQGFLSHVREQIAHCHRCRRDRPFHAFDLLVKTAGIPVNRDSDAFLRHIISPPPKKRHSYPW